MERCIHELIEQRATASPRAAAVLDHGGTTSYAELMSHAARVAGALRRRGVAPGVLVGLTGERSAALVAGLVGILKAGGGYVPFDAAHPNETIAHVLRDSGVRVVVTTRMAAGNLPAGVDPVVCDDPVLLGTETERYVSASLIGDVAMAIYTSGSTGAPKGVALAHRAILSRLRHGYTLRPNDLQKASISVIAHVSDLLLPLVNGATAVVVPDEVARDVASLAAFVRARGTTRLVFVPSQLWAVLEADERVLSDFRSVDTILLSGEPLTPALVTAAKRQLPWIRIFNAYGATEAGGLVAIGEVTEPNDITAGTCITGCDVLALDDQLRPVEDGQVGEIYCAGAQLAEGYVNDAVATAARFLVHPSGARIYRTGDLGRVLAGGRLEILGRIDDEVKVHGRRFRLADTERMLEAHPAVRRAAVVVAGDDSDRHLVAHVVLVADRAETDTASIRRYAASRLPGYMVPSVYREAATLPQLPTGKIDRHALMRGAPPPQGPAGAAGHGVYASVTESDLAPHWCTVLGVPSVVSTDRFLDVGGDSLRGMRLIVRIWQAFGVGLALEDLLLGDTSFASVAAAIEARRRKESVPFGTESTADRATRAHAGTPQSSDSAGAGT